METYVTVMLLTFSFIIGSCCGNAFLCFLDRKARKKSWVSAHSCCTACGHELAAKDLIPIVSYLLLRGRCRYCKKPYPMAILLSELIAGLGFLFAAFFVITNLQAGEALRGIAQGGICVLLSLAAVNDIFCHECAYVLQYGILALGILYALITGQWMNIVAALFCFCILMVIDIFYLKVRHIPDAIGLADIIVFTGVAFTLPMMGIPLLLLFSCVSSLLAMPLAKRNQTEQGIEEEHAGVGLLPFVLIGTFLTELLLKVL